MSRERAGHRPALEVEDLAVRFGTVHALDGVSFSMDEGSIVGLVGPNGAGKTTLIRVAATLLVPTAGRVGVFGVDVAADPVAVRKLIGYLPDVSGLYQDMRVDEHLVFFADAHGLDRGKREAYMQRALEMSGLGDRAEAFVEDLSLGMRARLSFVRSLAGDPRLLLLDEPFSGLDPMGRDDFRRMLVDLRGEGRAILVSSHQLEDLEKICDDVVLIDRGRIIEGFSWREPCRTHEVVLDAPPEDADARLAAIDGVTGVEELEAGRAFVLSLAEDSEPASIVARAVTAGLRIVAFGPRLPRLEERLRGALRRPR